MRVCVGAIHDTAVTVRHVVRHLAAAHLSRLLLRLPQTGALTSAPCAFLLMWNFVQNNFFSKVEDLIVASVRMSA